MNKTRVLATALVTAVLSAGLLVPAANAAPTTASAVSVSTAKVAPKPLKAIPIVKVSLDKSKIVVQAKGATGGLLKPVPKPPVR